MAQNLSTMFWHLSINQQCRHHAHGRHRDAGRGDHSGDEATKAHVEVFGQVIGPLSQGLVRSNSPHQRVEFGSAAKPRPKAKEGKNILVLN